MKVLLSLFYATIYALNVISFDLLDNGGTIIPNSIFVLQIIESIIFLVGALIYAKFIDSPLTIDKYLFLSGFLYCAFTFASYETVQYTNANFLSNLEFDNVALTFIVELIMKKANYNHIIYITTIVLSGVLANYGLIGMSENANLYGYGFGLSCSVIENIIGVLIVKGNDNKLTNFLSFSLGLLTSSIIVFAIEYQLLHLGTFNRYAYLSIGSNAIYLFCYFFIVDKFGIVFDSVSCNMSIIITLVFVLIHDDVYNLLIVIIGDVILLSNSLYYIKIHSGHDIVES